MNVNKFRPHVWVLPEDDANRKLIVGFLTHHAINLSAVGIGSPAGGWRKVLEVFENKYLAIVRKSADSHLLMVVDFDDSESRRVEFQQAIPEDLVSRVFVVGCLDEPESFKAELNQSLEAIGHGLAESCFKDDLGLWQHPHLLHNQAELIRLLPILKPIVFC